MMQTGDFAKRLTDLIKRNGKGTQARIAKAMGLPDARIHDWSRNDWGGPEAYQSRLDLVVTAEERAPQGGKPTGPKPNGSTQSANGSKAPPLDPETYLDEARAGAATRLRWETVDDIANSPDREYPVDRLLARGEISLWYGAPKVGKSFLLLHIAYALAAGAGTALGRRAEQATVLYIAAEGGAGLKDRICALGSKFGTTECFLVHRGAVDLRREDADASEIITKAKELSAGFIVVDTVNRALAGGDENNSKDMGVLVRNCDLIRKETGSHVAVIHHTPKGGDGSRGHSSLPAACDLLIAIGAESDGTRSATVREARNIQEGAAFRYRLVGADDVTDRHGRPIATCVVEELAELVGARGGPDRGKPGGEPTDRPKARSSDATRAKDQLAEMIAACGESVPSSIPAAAGARGVKEEAFRAEWIATRDHPSPEARRQAWSRTMKALTAGHGVACVVGWVWPPPKRDNVTYCDKCHAVTCHAGPTSACDM